MSEPQPIPHGEAVAEPDVEGDARIIELGRILHSQVPEDQQPLARMDYSDQQWERLTAAFMFAYNAGLAAQAAECAELAAECKAQSDELDRLSDESAAREALLNECLAVLEPYRAFADPREYVPPDHVITQGSSLAKRQLTMGDCYAAASLSTKIKDTLNGR